MFVIIGTQIRREDMGCLPEPWICPRCRRVVHLQIIRERRYFTLFWVPLFAVHSDEYYQCPCCGLTMQMDAAPYSPRPEVGSGQEPDPGQEVGAPAGIPDKSAESQKPSALQKRARQAGRLAGRFKRYLNE